MRYVMFFVSLGMFMLVACPERRIPELQPQEPVGPHTETQTVRPRGFDKPSDLNPGNIFIELVSSAAVIENLGKDPLGGKRYGIQLQTDYSIPWLVNAGSKDVNPSDIMLASFPNYHPIITLFDDKDTGPVRQQKYRFQMEWKENQVIEPMELHIVARNKRYCRNLVERSQQGQVTAENGIEPDIPESKAACDTMDGGNIYNFDQKVRLQLLVENVQSPAEARKDHAEYQFKQMIYCSVLKRIMASVLDGVVGKWSSGNQLLDLGKDIMNDVAQGYFDYKMSLNGYDCSGYDSEQSSVNTSTQKPGQTEKLGPGY